MLRHPSGAVAEAEDSRATCIRRFSRTAADWPACCRLSPTSSTCPSGRSRKYPKVKTPQEALDVVKQALIEARAAQAAALAPLTKGEIRELSSYIYPVMVGQNSVAHTLNDRGTGRRLVDLMEKMDRGAMVTAAEALFR